MRPFKYRALRARCRGQIAIMSALLLVVLIASAGLAVDAGMGYLLRARLSAAVDAAGIAAARAVVQGDNQAEQIANGKRAARIFFDANFPVGFLGAAPTWNDPSFTFERGRITVDTSAQATMPAGLMKVLGFQTLTAASQAQTVRRDLDMVFVMDTTGSMSSVASQVKESAQNFLSMFNVEADRVALVHFAVGAEVDVPFKANQGRGFDRAAMNRKIRDYDFGATTNYSEALWLARDQLNRVIHADKRSGLRVVVFFSDGAPNSFASYFNFKSSVTCNQPGSLATGDARNGTPSGLFRIDRQSQPAPGNCHQGDKIASRLAASAMPAYYNAHNAADREFQVAPNPPGMRMVDTSASWANINRAARNLAEEMSDRIRAEGIYIFTLGLGPEVHSPSGPDNESGEALLKNMAHTVDSSKFGQPQHSGQPVGVYCWAATTADLKPCFSQLASEILRLSR